MLEGMTPAPQRSKAATRRGGGYPLGVLGNLYADRAAQLAQQQQGTAKIEQAVQIIPVNPRNPTKRFTLLMLWSIALTSNARPNIILTNT